MQTQTGCRGPACLGPCDAPLAKAGQITPLIPLERGQDIEITWPRNNHAGGFIRIAFAPLNQSDRHTAFNQRVWFWTCHEMTCKSSSADPTGGDSDGGAPGNCRTSIKAPPQLADGKWTMQWAWVGGSFQLGDYYSCVDYEVQGGEPVSNEPMRPVFQGGDVHFPHENKCMFFNANDVGICVNEPCTNGNMPGEQSGAPRGFETGSTSNQTRSPDTPRSDPTSNAPPRPRSTNTRFSEPTPEFRSAELDSPEKSIKAVYTETFVDRNSGRFGATLSVTNIGTRTLGNWTIRVLFPSPSQQIEEVFGAGHRRDASGVHYVFSTALLRVDQIAQVGILGTL